MCSLNPDVIEEDSRASMGLLPITSGTNLYWWNRVTFRSLTFPFMVMHRAHEISKFLAISLFQVSLHHQAATQYRVFYNDSEISEESETWDPCVGCKYSASNSPSCARISPGISNAHLLTRFGWRAWILFKTSSPCHPSILETCEDICWSPTCPQILIACCRDAPQRSFDTRLRIGTLFLLCRFSETLLERFGMCSILLSSLL